MFNILSQITLKVKFLRKEEQRCLLPSLVDDFTCVHSKNALLTHILSTLFSSTSVLFSCAPFGTKSYICDNDVVGINLRCSGQVCKCPIWTSPNLEDFAKKNSFFTYNMVLTLFILLYVSLENK